MHLDIDPHRWYDEQALRLMGLDAATLDRARDRGDLQARDLGRQTLYRGAWLIAWLEGRRPGEQSPGTPASIEQELASIRLLLQGLLAALTRGPGRDAPAPPAGREDALDEQLVDLDQCAAMVSLRKRSLERYLGQMPRPRIRGGRGRASRWAWSEVRPWLEQTFGRPLPERFPG